MSQARREGVAGILLLAAHLQACVQPPEEESRVGVVRGSLSISPAGWWMLDGSTTDSSENGNDGSLVNGPEWVGGRFNGGLGFDGTNWVDLGNPAQLNFGTGSFTYMMWVKTSTSLGAWDTPWWKGGEQAASPGYDIELGSGPWNAYLSDGTTAVGARLSWAPILNTTWR